MIGHTPAQEAEAAGPHDALRAERRRAGVEAALVGLVIAGVVGAAIAGAWSASTSHARAASRDRLDTLARFAADQVDPSLHGLLRRREQTDDHLHRRALEPLQRLRTVLPEVKRVYTVVLDGPDLRYVLDATTPGDADRDGREDRAAIGDPVTSDTVTKRLALGGGADGIARSVTTQAPYAGLGGTVVMSGYVPFHDRAGRLAGAAGVDVDAAAYVAQLNEARRRLLWGLLPAALLILALTCGTYRLRLRGHSSARIARDAAWQEHRSARRDRLTQCANRLGFTERLADASGRIASGNQAGLAVLFLDFDHFKLVNDTMGHAAGDELLRQIATRLRGALELRDALDVAPRVNVVARFGGDEFVVLANDVAGEPAAHALAERLLQALAPAYLINGTEVRSTASIGVAVDTLQRDDAESLIRYADVAMYAAKRNGRGCCVMFDDSMQASLARRVTIERSLLKAIGTSQLQLAYQPIIELETGRLAAVEALLRWSHPQLGELSPREFVPIAEESGLIGPLGEWVLGEACRQLASWRARFPGLAPETINVNVSRAELALGERLVDRIRAALADAGLPAQSLQLELAERDVLRADPSNAGLMRALRELGVRLAMDEFGSGTSSLARLREHPFDTVKVDRSFVHGMATSRDVMALMHATLTLLENVGMSSIAEGVEDAAQLAILQSLGCRYAQGKHLGDAVPGDRVIEWHRQRGAAHLQPVVGRPSAA